MIEKGGERGGNRTYNLLIKSQLLCQLSYAPACEETVQKGNSDYNIAVAQRRVQNLKSMPMFCAISLVARRNCPGSLMKLDCPPVFDDRACNRQRP